MIIIELYLLYKVKQYNLLVSICDHWSVLPNLMARLGLGYFPNSAS